jgi:hypothetical protein
MLKSSNDNTRKARFECLEDRNLMASNVTAALTGGALSLTGDNNANYLIVHQTGANRFQVQGINTNIHFGSQTSRSITFSGVTDIGFIMRGGNDSVTVYNTSLTGSMGVEMGKGNDVLSITNLRADNLGVNLDQGNDVAAILKVTTPDDGAVGVSAGDGRDAVALNTVRTNGLGVEMGPGNFDSLAVAFCTAEFAGFADTGGTNGVLTRVGNHFDSETVSGFRWVV